MTTCVLLWLYFLALGKLNKKNISEDMQNAYIVHCTFNYCLITKVIFKLLWSGLKLLSLWAILLGESNDTRKNLSSNWKESGRYILGVCQNSIYFSFSCREHFLGLSDSQVFICGISKIKSTASFPVYFKIRALWKYWSIHCTNVAFLTTVCSHVSF